MDEMTEYSHQVNIVVVLGNGVSAEATTRQLPRRRRLRHLPKGR